MSKDLHSAGTPGADRCSDPATGETGRGGPHELRELGQVFAEVASGLPTARGVQTPAIRRAP